MKKIISILTATRAEYGLLRSIIVKMKEIPEFDVRVVATGAHLSPEFGMTYQEIENDGIKIDRKIDVLLSSDTPAAISKTMGLAIIGFADYFTQLKPDLLIVLGDRYETLAVCCAAMNQGIPIAHLHGGETTEGAIDESIRHSITKLSYLHFTSTEEYRNRVIQLGEDPSRVFCVGSTGVENIVNEQLMTKAELEAFINLKLDKPYAMITYHPVTLEYNNTVDQFQALLNILKKFKDMKFIFSKANADANGRIINKMIDNFVKENSNSDVFASLGTIAYLSALKYCSIVIGNSSSGIIEAPSFGVPIINIGNRQKGRIQTTSIINCEPIESQIERSFILALTEEYKNIARKAVNPYGKGNTSEKIVAKIKEFLFGDKIDLKKKFYDREVR